MTGKMCMAGEPLCELNQGCAYDEIPRTPQAVPRNDITGLKLNSNGGRHY